MIDNPGEIGQNVIAAGFADEAAHRQRRWRFAWRERSARQARAT